LRQTFVQRQGATLAADVGYNVSPESTFQKYDTIGAEGTFLTDRKAISDVLGDFKPGKQAASWEQTAALEEALGLESGSLANGFRVTSET
jgi:hypothetical protein